MIPRSNRLHHSHYRIIFSTFFILTLIAAGFSTINIQPTAAAGTITVNTTADDPVSCALGGITCLRDAIATANGNGAPTTINFSVSGNIHLASTLSLNNGSGVAITIDGTGNNIVIDGGGAVQDMTIAASTTVNLTSLVIANGLVASNGAGVLNNGSTLTLSNVTFSGNTAVGSKGGALYNSGGALAINNSLFTSNSADSDGGALVSVGGSLSITNTRFSGNASLNFGGGVYNGTPGAVFTNDTFAGNSSANSGGGLYNTQLATVVGSTFSANSGFAGGGIYSSATLLISNSTLSGNLAPSHTGGGLENTGTLTIANSTIAGNSASGGTGGGVHNTGTLNTFSTILDGNSASAGPDLSGSVVSGNYNLISNTSGSSGFTGTHDVLNQSAKLGPLANYGGPTQTRSILNGSPAIYGGNCTGNSSFSPNAPSVVVDQRGINRKVSPACDVGAYESNSSPPTPTATNTPTNTATNTPTNTATNTPTPTNTPVPARIDTIGVFRSGTFYLRLHNSTGFAEITMAFNPASKPYPVVGDWTGASFDTVGVFDQSNGLFTVCTANDTTTCANTANQISFVLGNPNDIPLSGKWNAGFTHFGAGVFRPSNGLIYLKNNLTTGFADYTMVLGIPGDDGLAGDWNGDGLDSPGVYRPSTQQFYLNDQICNCAEFASYTFQYGVSGDTPVVGDWIGQGHDGIGLFRQSNGYTYLKNALTTGYADNTFVYGIANDVPVAGHYQLVYPPRPAPGSVLVSPTSAPFPNGGPGD